jgi:hypothetical protein
MRGCYKHMKFFALFLISVLSSSAFAKVVFDGCEPLVCKQLLSQIENGIPIYSGGMDTGRKLDLDASDISKIIQSDGNFQLCAGATTIYKVNYSCTANKPCRFISDGSKSKSRTQFDVCL